MIKRRCSWCKKVMVFKLGEPIKSFCSKQCYGMDKEKRFASEDSGPPMPPLKVENITDEGYIALMKAVVSRAGQDVTKFKPGTQIRVSAEKFFESEWFSALTGLDGKPILRELQEEYKRKHKHKKLNYSTSPVRCVETGMVYESIKAAGETFAVSPKSIYNVCKGYDKTAGGMHWEYVKEEA